MKGGNGRSAIAKSHKVEWGEGEIWTLDPDKACPHISVATLNNSETNSPDVLLYGRFIYRL